MTLQDWKTQNPKWFVEHDSTGGAVIHDKMQTSAARVTLWGLSDYHVTTVGAGVIRLQPTRKVF